MRPYELIKAKRNGQVLDPGDIREFIAAYTRGDVADYQMSAMCMAVYFRGLTPPELEAWVEAMLHSGEVYDLKDIPGVKVDKHSTGGVGDKVSLCLAPLAAVCGVPVPMISGRGLGHTGGTLDKLESIPGFRIQLSTEEYRQGLLKVGASLVGQSPTLVPADRKLYALRDVTATVDCIPLIASSIMSKKMAEGIDALVLDVKVGTGAFMRTVDEARVLARTMIDIGARMGRKVVALLTDMDQPLGRAVGNALEVVEAIDVLKGQAPEDLTECTLALTAEMLVLGKQAANVAQARKRLQAVIDDGSALGRLEDIVRNQGGSVEAIRDPSKLARAKQVAPVAAPRAGYVGAIDCEAVGHAAMALGAGRVRVDSPIDPAVGLIIHKKLGDRVEAGEPLVDLHLNDPATRANAEARILAAYQLTDAPVTPRPLVLERVE